MADKAANLRTGAEMATESIDSGRAKAALGTLARITREVAA